MFGLALLSFAVAAPEDDISEEIIIYGDDFARWDDTRWLVQSELILPLGARFASDRNRAFTSYAFQIRTVIGCSKDAKLSKRKWEVSCEIEDIGILATSQRHWRRDKDRQMVQEILDQIDAKITGARVQMQVDLHGGLNNFDIEGIDASNDREREIQETLRQIVSRVMVGFHLRIPDHAQRGGQFVEYRSELMDLPSLTSSRGTSTLVHLVTPDRPRKGLQLLQTVGEGVASVSLPVATTTDPFHASLEDPGTLASSDEGGGMSGKGALSAEAPDGATADEQESTAEITYALKATGVALFEKETGIMTERVWACHGFPTASSANGMRTPPYRNVGRMRLLGTEEKPDVGPTRQVAWPTRERDMSHLPPWIDIESMPGESDTSGRPAAVRESAPG